MSECKNCGVKLHIYKWSRDGYCFGCYQKKDTHKDCIPRKDVEAIQLEIATHLYNHQGWNDKHLDFIEIIEDKLNKLLEGK